MSDVQLQEIVTRAVVGRGERRVVWSHDGSGEGADSVLGVHVSQSTVLVEKEDGADFVRLQVTCELWCAHGEGTRVLRFNTVHREPVRVNLNARVVGETETTARLEHGVRCTSAEIREGSLFITLEGNVAVEVTGDARLWVRAYSLLGDELEDLSTSSSSWSESSTGESSDSSGTSDLSESDLTGEYAADEGSLDEADPFVSAVSGGSGTSGDLTATLSQVSTLEEAYAPAHAGDQPRGLAKAPTQTPARGPARNSRPLISHFQQSTNAGRVSIIQG